MPTSATRASRTTTKNVDAAASVISPVQLVAVTGLPQRPDSSILSDAIPLYFIGRNRDGFWVARDADGRVGGIFFRKQSALKFAKRSALPGGCATMFLSEGLELDIENKGNPLVARLGAVKHVLTRFGSRLTASLSRRGLYDPAAR